VIVLGIDPGTRQLGWGVVRREGNRLVHIGHGVVRAAPTDPLAQRLCHIDQQLSLVIERFRPDTGSVETLFFHKDAQAAAKLGHARGVALLVLARAGLSIAEYQPARVKRTIAGRGMADKRQIAMVVRAVLSLDAPPPSDAADALALAITHLRLGSLPEAVGSRLGSAASRIRRVGIGGRPTGRGRPNVARSPRNTT
jgi:crossover junction endodeoxyribonuclease RuvC